MNKDDALLVARSMRVVRFLRSDPVRFRTSLEWADRVGLAWADETGPVGRFALRAVLVVARNEKRIGARIDVFIRNVLQFGTWIRR